jgi:hypothetical protein
LCAGDRDDDSGDAGMCREKKTREKREEKMEEE